MATYNGEQYIEEQLKSVLKQLNDNDEIIISDDGSTDSTMNIIDGIGDCRIKVFKGPGKGVKRILRMQLDNAKENIFSFVIRMMYGITIKLIHC